ncbi:MAG: hypothetical protein CMK89_08505 [Pseudomonadales bacterium]|nr:hypothetical protein [Pseudomonadales bacterium]
MRYLHIIIGLVLITACISGCDKEPGPAPQPAEHKPAAKLPLPQPHYVGAQHCQGCHEKAYQDWQDSHHDLAMQEVSGDTVLGDFNQTRFEYNGVTTEFSQEDNEYYIKTDGPDGKLTSYPVAYVFGVYPLQQYLIALPGGKLQAFGIAWDSRPQTEGGQRWFHLYPDQQVDHQDYLHWTNQSQTWNFMCAECHSTNLNKNYDTGQRSYNTTWSEIDVACEACHGPGSNHLLWASEAKRNDYKFKDKKGLTHLFNERANVHWMINTETGQPQRSEPGNQRTEIQVCAACHSRRAQFFEDSRQGQGLLQSYLPATLDAGLYHSDGQVNDEVYVYGSFLQSKMYQAGVTCSDCHNPHSLALKLPGDGVCLQCHESSYAKPEHHHHTTDSAQCIDCHMPVKNFMVVDARRDHSFRIPRPDLSDSLDTPNTCNHCHNKESAQWAANQIKSWYPEPNLGYQDFADIIAAGRESNPSAKAPLQGLVSDLTQTAIVRATAATLLASYLDASTLQTLSQALQDPDPLVRIAAARSLQTLPPDMRWPLLSPLLQDAVRLVRVIAAETLSDIPSQTLAPQDARLLRHGVEEYVASQNFNGDSPQSQVNLGLLAVLQGQPDQAFAHYEEAIALDDTWIPAYVNLADLYRMLQQDEQGKTVLKKALKRFPQDADLHFSLGLLLIRQQQHTNALEHLKQAAELAPMNARYQYVYAVGLHSTGRSEEALRVTRNALKTLQDPNLTALEQQLSNL